MKHTPYQPLTSDESVFSVAQQTIGKQIQTAQMQNVQRRQRIEQITSFPFQIGESIKTIFATRDDEIIRGLKLAKAQHDIDFEEKLSTINLDNTVPTVEKNMRKRQLTDQWKNQSEIMIRNFEDKTLLKPNSDFIKSTQIETEHNYNKYLSAIGEEANKLSKAENDQNRTALINNLKAVTTVQRVDKERRILENDVVTDKSLNEYEKRTMLYNLNQIADGQKFDIITKEVNDLAFKDPRLAITVLESQINLLQNNDKYLTALEKRVPKIDALQKQKNALLLALQKTDQKAAVERILSNIDFNDTYVTSQNKILTDPEFQKLDDQSKVQVIGMATKTIETLNTAPADFAAQKLNVSSKDMRGYISIRQKLDQEGFSSKSGLPKDAATLFKSTYGALGSEQKDAQGVILTNQEKFNRWIAESEIFLGSKDNLLKEAQLHLDAKDALAIEAQIKGASIANELLNISIKSHSEGRGAGPESKSLPKQKMRQEASDLYYSTARGQYYSRLDSAVAGREASTFSELSGITNSTIDKLTKQLNHNDGFIIDEKYNIKFDSSLYNEKDIKYGIKAVLQNPDKFLTKVQLTQGEKWDLRGGITAQTDDKGYIIFKLTGNVAEDYQSKTGNPFIARLHISELPPRPVSQTKLDFAPKQPIFLK